MNMGFGSGMDPGGDRGLHPPRTAYYVEKSPSFAHVAHYLSKTGQDFRKSRIIRPPENFGSTSAWDLSRQVSTKNSYSQAGPTFLHLCIELRCRLVLRN